MSNGNVLLRSDMEKTRTPRELCDWVDSVTSVLSETADGKRYARSGATLPKKLWEEIRPLGLFARHRYGSRSDVKCTPNLGNENYDGRIDFDDKSTPSIYVEITYAKDGHDESLRLRVLSENGTVNLLGPIATSGTKASGKQTIHVENESVNHEVTRAKNLKTLEERITSKSNKNYGPNHVLVIVIDDYIAFRNQDDRVVLAERAKSVVDCAKPGFGEVFLLGSSGNYLATVV